MGFPNSLSLPLLLFCILFVIVSLKFKDYAENNPNIVTNIIP